MKATIAGYLETSLNDVIGEVSFVIWFCGCNLRCPYCQNFPMVIMDKHMCRKESLDVIIDSIRKVRGFIGYVQVTGGEPTLQPDALGYLYTMVKEMGIGTSLDTNGTRPDVIDVLISKKLIDHVAMDVKAPLNPDIYARAVGIPESVTCSVIDRIILSLEKVSRLDFVEIRTTYVPGILSIDNIMTIAEQLEPYLKRDRHYYVIQQFIPNRNAPDPMFRTGKVVELSKLMDIARRVARILPNVVVRHIGGVEYVNV